MNPHFHLVSEQGLSDLIPTNLEREDPVMDADHHSLPDVAIQPNKPPGFDGYNYPFWKFRMETYIKSNGIRLWDVIEQGDHVHLDDDGFAKARSRFTNEDYALVELNYRAMHYIQKHALEEVLMTTLKNSLKIRKLSKMS